MGTSGETSKESGVSHVLTANQQGRLCIVHVFTLHTSREHGED